jgi:hypothetical protein
VAILERRRRYPWRTSVVDIDTPSTALRPLSGRVTRRVDPFRHDWLIFALRQKSQQFARLQTAWPASYLRCETWLTGGDRNQCDASGPVPTGPPTRRVLVIRPERPADLILRCAEMLLHASRLLGDRVQYRRLLLGVLYAALVAEPSPAEQSHRRHILSVPPGGKRKAQVLSWPGT